MFSKTPKARLRKNSKGNFFKSNKTNKTKKALGFENNVNKVLAET